MSSYYINEKGHIVVTQSITTEAYNMLKSMGYKIMFFF